jgi:hypothetical protein
MITKGNVVTPFSLLSSISQKLKNIIPFSPETEIGIITQSRKFQVTLVSSVVPGGSKYPPIFGESVDDFMYWMPIQGETLAGKLSSHRK